MSVYEVDGIQYPSVTTILGIIDKSGALIPWALNCMGQYLIDHSTVPAVNPTNIHELVSEAKKEYRSVSQEALDIGSEVHDAIESYIKSSNPNIEFSTKEAENAFSAFLDWESENIEKWLETEQKVYNPIIGYAGQLDAIAKMKNGKIYLIDFKTSKGFFPEMPLQLSAYKTAREGLTGKITYRHKTQTEKMAEFTYNYPEIDIDGIGVLRLDKISELPYWKDYTNEIERSWEAFEYLTGFYYRFAKRRLKGNSRI